MTLVFNTGFEHGATWTINGGGLSGQINAGVAPVVDATAKRSGNYGLHLQPTDASECFTRGPTLAASNMFVGRFYFCFHTWPTTGGSNALAEFYHTCVTTASNLDFRLTVDHKVAVYGYNTLLQTGNITIQLDTWYRLDFRFDASANPWVIDWQMAEGDNPGTNQPQATRAMAADTFACMAWGNDWTVNTYDLYIDDAACSNTSGDYPIGPGAGALIKPESDGTHNNAANCIEDQLGNDINGTTYPAWDKINSVPPSNAAYLRVGTASAGKYAEVNLSNMPSGKVPNGARGIIAYTSATTSANNGGSVIMDGANEREVWGRTGTYKDYSDGALTNLFYKSAQVSMGTLDETNINALKARFISGDDATPDPYLIDLWVEVDYQIAGGNLTGAGNIGSAFAAGVPNVKYNMTAVGFNDGSAFGTAVVSIATNLTGAGGIASQAAYGVPIIRPRVNPVGLSSGAAFGTPSVRYNLGAAGNIASGQAMGTVSIRPRLASAGGIASAQALGVVGIRPRLAATGIASGTLLGTPVTRLTLGTAGGIATGAAFGVPGLRVRIIAVAISSAENIGRPVVTTEGGPVQLGNAGGIASAAAYGVPNLSIRIVVLAGISSQQALGTPAVRARVVLAGITSQEALGAPTLVWVEPLRPVGIASAEAIGVPTLVYDHYIVAVGMVSAEGFGVPNLNHICENVYKIRIEPRVLQIPVENRRSKGG